MRSLEAIYAALPNRPGHRVFWWIGFLGPTKGCGVGVVDSLGTQNTHLGRTSFLIYWSQVECAMCNLGKFHEVRLVDFESWSLFINISMKEVFQRKKGR